MRKIIKNLQTITKINPFINKYNWKEISFPSEKDDWKKFEKNNVTIALSVLYAKKEKYILLIFQNITQIVKNKLFFQTDKMALSCSKKLSALLRGITSKYYGDFYCLNSFHSFRTKNKLELHKRVCENKDFCNIIMPSEDTKI